MKKIIGFITLVLVLILGYLGFTFLNFGSNNHLYSYLSEKDQIVLLNNYSNKDSLELNNKVIDKIKNQHEFISTLNLDDESKKDIELAYEYLEQNSDLRKNTRNFIFLKNMLLTTTYNFDYNLIYSDTDTDDILKNIVRETSIFVKTKLSDKTLEKILTNDDLKKDYKLTKIDNKKYKFVFDFSKEFNIDINDFIVEGFLGLDKGNIVITLGSDRVADRIKNKENPTNNELITTVKENYKADFLFAIKNSMYGLLYSQYNVKDDKISIEANLISDGFIPSLKDTYFKHNGEDGLYGKRKVAQNIAYIRTTGDLGLLEHSPVISINSKGEKNGKEVDIKMNQILYAELYLNDDFNAELKGYIEKNKVSLNLILDENVLLNFFDLKKVEKISYQLNFLNMFF